MLIKKKVVLSTIAVIVIIIVVLTINTYNKTAFPLSCPRQITCPDCNLILISVDSLRADHIGALGYKRNTTPFIDILAKKSFLFSNYFTSSYLTPVTEASVHTGLYPSSHGVTTFQSILSKKIKTLPEMLKKQGYGTAAIFTSPEFNEKEYPGLKESFSRGFDYYQYSDAGFRANPSIGEIESRLDPMEKNKFFWWFAIGSVHWPYGLRSPKIFTNVKYQGFFKDRILNWTNTLSYIYDNVYHASDSPSLVKLEPEDLQYVTDRYDDAIYNFDSFIRSLYQLLASKDLLKKTIIVIMSEHGESFGENGMIAHYDIYDNQIHTPLLIFTPQNRSGKKISSLVSSVDILPTLSELLGLSPHPQVQGRSLVPVMCNLQEMNSSNEAVFIERNPLWEQARINPVHDILKNAGIMVDLAPQKDIAIRTSKWKYIQRLAKNTLEKISWWSYVTKRKIIVPDEELYDIVADPGEKNNLIDKYPSVAKTLQLRLEAWHQSIILDSARNGKNVERIQEYF